MLQFTFYVTHDNGKVKIKTNALNLNAAITAVQLAEKCPLSAITLKSILPAKGHKIG